MNFSSPLDCVRRWLVVVVALMLMSLASTSLDSVLAQTPDDRDAAAKQALDEGFILSQQGSAESLRAAIRKSETALNLYRETENHLGEALALLSIGSFSNELGEKRRALDYYSQALPLFKALRNNAGEATTLNNMGLVYSNLGEKQRALELYNKVPPLLRTIHDLKDRDAEGWC